MSVIPPFVNYNAPHIKPPNKAINSNTNKIVENIE